MRLAYIPGSLNPGGAETQTARHVVRLRERGYWVTVILPHGAGDMEGNLRSYLELHNVEIVNLVSEPHKRLALEAALSRLKPDAIHTVGYPVTLAATLAAYKAGVPVRVMRLDNTGFTRTQYPQEWTYEFAGMRAATHIVGNSQAVIDSVDSYYGGESIPRRVIPNGVTLPEITPAMRATARSFWGLDDDAVAVGLLANFREDGIKNQGMLVRAAARVVESHPNARFILAGYPSAYLETVQAEINRLGVGASVKLPGRISNLDLLAGWDIAVNCSITEGFCNALQECMAYGLPVVATRVGGNPELVDDGKTGTLVESDDDTAMAEALGKLIKSKAQREKLGKAGRDHAEKHWSWDVVLGQWLDLYREGLNG